MTSSNLEPASASSSPLTSTGLHHVRVPVADLAGATTFWEETFGYVWDFDFPGADGPAASALRHPDGGPNVVLWVDAERAKALSGFVLFGIGVPGPEHIEALKLRLDERSVPHGGIQGAFVDVKLPFVQTPEGLLISFYVKPSAHSVAPARKE